MESFRNIKKKRNTGYRKELEKTSAGVMEMVGLIPLTKARPLEEEEVTKNSRQPFAAAEEGSNQAAMQPLFSPVGRAIFHTTQDVSPGFTGMLALKGSVDPGDVTLYQSYVATIVRQVSTPKSHIPVMDKGVESVNPIGEVLLEEHFEGNDGKEALDSVEGESDGKNVRPPYNTTDTPVLHALDLHIANCGTSAPVGESGAGKATILDLVTGLNLATGGADTIDGHGVRGIDPRSYR